MMEFDRGFTIFSVIFGVLFLLVFTIIVWAIIKGIVQWNKNNHAPRLTVNALIASKRMNVSYSHNSNSGSSTTYYYATFQVDSGDRMELQVRSYEYGMLAEGDYGSLTFQGTRYLDFQRYN